jgi:DNA-binding CsgD family transcriptional regulator
VTVTVTGSALTLDEVVRVAHANEPVELPPDARERIRISREIVARAIEDGGLIYGVTTGVGVRKRTRVDAADLPEFNRRLILEHRVGQGPPAPEPVVRAQMLVCANGFARGTSGVRVEVVVRIVDALNAGATGYLLKDAEPDELRRAVTAAARGDAPLAPKAARVLLEAKEEAKPVEELTERERDVLRLVARGKPNKLIARDLGISEKTVKAHLTSIFRSIGVDDRTQAAIWASRHGLIDS